MQIKKNLMETTLKKCLPGIEKGSSLIAGADAFVFDKGSIFAYNDSLYISVANVFPEELSGAVKANDFLKLVNRLKGETLEIEVDEENAVWNVKCGRSKSKVKLLEAAQVREMTTYLSGQVGEFKDLPENFIEALKLCQMRNKSQFQGIIVDQKDMFSTDGVSLNNYAFKEAMDPFWITDQASAELLGFSTLKGYQVGESWVHFNTEDGITISCRTKAAENYPLEGLRGLIPTLLDKEGTVQNRLPKELAEATERASVLATDVSGALAIRLTIKKTEIVLYSERSTGSLEETIPLATPFEESPDLEIWLDSIFLKEAPGKVEDFYIKEVNGTLCVIFFNEHYLQSVASIQVA